MTFEELQEIIEESPLVYLLSPEEIPAVIQQLAERYGG